MRKRLLSLALALTLCLGLMAPAFAAEGTNLPDEGRIQVYDNTVFVINQDGKLWLYKLNDDMSDYSSVYITDNAKQILFYDGGGGRLFLLKNNGELFLGRSQYFIEEPAQYYETKITDHVVKFGLWSGNIYTLKEDGTLWSYDWPGEVPDAEGFVSSGVKDIAVDKDGYYRGYLTATAANFLNQKVGGLIDNGERIYYCKYAGFVITADGSLWNLGGSNSTGECGNGGKHTYDSFIYFGELPIAPAGSLLTASMSCDNKTEKILSHVESLYFDQETNSIVAIQTDGSAWTWGNAKEHTYTVTAVDSSGRVSAIGDLQPPVDMTGYSPRKLASPPSQRGFRHTNTILAQSDGTLLCKDTDTGRTLALPNWSAGAAAEPQQPANVAYASTQSVLVDGSPVEFQCYALKDANGNDTNYIKLRDVASVLNGTPAQFNVGWDGAVNIETGKGYTPNGSELQTPFSGNRAYETAAAETRINGSPAALEAIVLKDDNGGAYTYYKLRDLGAALGFTVDWSADKGIFIETE